MISGSDQPMATGVSAVKHWKIRITPSRFRAAPATHSDRASEFAIEGFSVQQELEAEAQAIATTLPVLKLWIPQEPDSLGRTLCRSLFVEMNARHQSNAGGVRSTVMPTPRTPNTALDLLGRGQALRMQ